MLRETSVIDVMLDYVFSVLSSMTKASSRKADNEVVHECSEEWSKGSLMFSPDKLVDNIDG